MRIEIKKTSQHSLGLFFIIINFRRRFYSFIKVNKGIEQKGLEFYFLFIILLSSIKQELFMLYLYLLIKFCYLVFRCKIRCCVFVDLEI